jgi:hypothetical protein
LGHAGAVLLLSAAACLLLKKSKAAYALLFLLTMDLLVAARPVHPIAPRHLFQDEPELVSLVRKNSENGRFYRQQETVARSLEAPSNRIEWQYRWNLETFNMHLASYFRIPTIYHPSLDRLANSRMSTLIATVNSVPWDRRISLLSAGSVKTILAEEELNLPGVEKVASVKNASGHDFFLYRNSLAVPDPSFYTAGLIVSDADQARQALLSPSFDPQRFAILEYSGPVTSCAGTPAKVTTTGFDEFFVETSCAGFLVFSRTHYDGYRIRINEQEAPVIRANLAFFGVFLPAGKHAVSLRFVPSFFFAGALLSVLTAVALVALLMRSKQRAAVLN